MTFFTMNIHPRATSVDDLIMSVGRGDFSSRLATFLDATCGAEFCSVYELKCDEIVHLACAGVSGASAAEQQLGLYVQEGYWRRDEALRKARACCGGGGPAIVRALTSELTDRALRRRVYSPSHIFERLIVTHKVEGRSFALSLLRSDARGAFSEGDYASIRKDAGNIISLVAKQAELDAQAAALLAPFAGANVVEAYLARLAAQLTRREAQVCARIILGMSTEGIALELGVGSESVSTYRKRAYQRLGVASHRELTLWYLSRCGH